MSTAPHLFFTYPQVHRFRAAERAALELPATLWRGRGPVRGRSIEVSATGVVLRLAAEEGRVAPAPHSGALAKPQRPASRPYPLSEPLLVKLELELPTSGRAVEALGRWVWAAEDVVAVTFVKMADADRLSLAELVDAQVGAPGELAVLNRRLRAASEE